MIASFPLRLKPFSSQTISFSFIFPFHQQEHVIRVFIVDGLAIEDFRKHKQVLEGELKRFKASTEPLVEGLKEKVATLEEQLSAKDWLQEQYNTLSEHLPEKDECWRVDQAEATTALESTILQLQKKLQGKGNTLTKAQIQIESIKISSQPFKVQSLDDETEGLKFALERAEAASKSVSVELDIPGQEGPTILADRERERHSIV
ncbi:hypothetical protein R1sor_009544 [Riccia sorocarpa]|uniref:Uncharacterized protein n=1 Tax=Riccia sorocarpa TaxID=122646 RepID=A0ABD3HVN2_9MARC